MMDTRDRFNPLIRKLPPLPRRAAVWAAAFWAGTALGLAAPDTGLSARAQIAGLARRGAQGSLAFTVLGDSRQERKPVFRWIYRDNDVFQTFLKAINGRDSDFTMHLGDIVPTGSAEEYRDMEKELGGSGLRAAFLVAIGNHEVHDKAGLENYRKLFGSPYYFFDFKGFRFIVVDSSRRRIGSEQMKWLKGVLDTKRRKIVFTHMPPMPLQNWTDGRLLGMLARKTNRILRDDGTFTDLMGQARVERVYTSHIHAFGQADYKGVRYVLSGGAGSPLYPWHLAKYRFFHFIRVTVGPDGAIREEVCLKDQGCRPISSYPVFPEGHFSQR